MPVLSPRRTSSSALSGGSYRSTFGTSSLDRPFYNSPSNFSPRINSYTERFTSRSYIDGDGRRVYTRQASITEDGVTTRYKEELRESSAKRDSLSRDSGISSIRENSVYEIPRRDRDRERENSLTSDNRSSESRSRLSAINVAESVAEMRNKYSPANYVPACQRKNEIMSRSKSINDIGKPPVDRPEQKNAMKLKVNDSLNYNNGLGVTNLSNNTNSLEKVCDNVMDEDDNGNRASVAEIRKRFDQHPYRGSKTENNLLVEGTGIKISENRFKKQDSLESITVPKSKYNRIKTDVTTLNNERNEPTVITNGSSMLTKDKIVEKTESRPAKLSKLAGNLKKVAEKIKPESQDTNNSKQKIGTTLNFEVNTNSNKNSVGTKLNVDINNTNKQKIGATPNFEANTNTNKISVGTKLSVDTNNTNRQKEELQVGSKSKIDIGNKQKPDNQVSPKTFDITKNRQKNENQVSSKSNSDTSEKCTSEPNGVENNSKLNVSDNSSPAQVLRNGVGLGGNNRDIQTDLSNEDLSGATTDKEGELSRSITSRTSNLPSYISSKDFRHGDTQPNESQLPNGDILTSEENDMDRNFYSGNSRYYQTKTNNDISSSPRLNRAISQAPGNSGGPSTSTSIPTNSYQRASNSLERDRRDRDDDRNYDRSLGSSSVKNLGLNGLKNIGNTCFMNSVIQCLSNTKLLLEYVKNDAYTADINTSISSMKGALIKAFSHVIKELWSEDASDRVVNTLSLKSQIQRFAPRFMGYSQQDAQEFLRYLLEGLHEDVNRVTSKPTPILTEIDEKLSDVDKAAESWQRYLRMDNSKVVDIFVGQLKSTLKCTHCGHSSVTFDPFWDLSLPIPQRAGPLRLQQCLEYFTREETLDGDEKPTCSKCKERRKCTKSLSIQKFPKILVIHLKRFSPTERFRGKLSVSIDFPLEGLDMRNYAAESGPSECRYNLYAISNHSGTTYSGHYTAYCRHPYSLAWHEYNDSRVSPISSKSIVSGEAYVLFYELDNQKSHL